jgi:hypothetical protein
MVSRDAQTVQLLGAYLGWMNWLDDGAFLVYHGATEVVYEVRFDGTWQQTAIGTSELAGGALYPIDSNPYLMFAIIQQRTMQTYIIDVRNGVADPYFVSGEVVGGPVYWRWE